MDYLWGPRLRMIHHSNLPTQSLQLNALHGLADRSITGLDGRCDRLARTAGFGKEDLQAVQDLRGGYGGLQGG